MPTKEGQGTLTPVVQDDHERDVDAAPALAAEGSGISCVSGALQALDCGPEGLVVDGILISQDEPRPGPAEVSVVALPPASWVVEESPLPQVGSYLHRPRTAQHGIEAAARFRTHGKPRVLVVEDQMAVRSLLEQALRHHGLEVALAAGGEEALEFFRQHPGMVDVVLLDVHMPGMDGPQTLAALRQIDAAIPAVFMSGCTGKYSAEDLRQLGASFIEKPFPCLAKLAGLLQGAAKRSGRSRS